MSRYGGEHLATDTLDVTGTEMVAEQAGDIGCAGRMAEGRCKLSPGEDRMSRQEAGGLVLARLHGRSTILRDRGNKLALMTHICQLRLIEERPDRCPLSRGKRTVRAINYPFRFTL